MQAASRPVLFPITQSVVMSSSLQQQTPSVPFQGKKRYVMPQNEIDQLSIFRPPDDEFRPDNRQYAQFDYDRNLMTDSIDGAKSGTRTSPVLKNILRAKELAQFNRNHPYSQYQNYQPQQQYSQKPTISSDNFQKKQASYQKQPIFCTNKSQQISFTNQNQQQYQYFKQPQNTQQRAGQHILYNGQLIMNDNLQNEHGFQGFERMGKKSNSVYKFGSGLKDMGLM